MSTASLYDAVIVGAGVAGALVAKRLSRSGMTVLVLEAGPGSTRSFDGYTEHVERFYAATHKGPESPWPPALAAPQPDTGDKDFLEELNLDSLKVVTAYVEPSLGQAHGDEKFQFERHGYFVGDRKDHLPGEGKPVFNRVTGLKDSWGK